MQQQALNLYVPPRYSFSNFISCSGNSSALEFCRRLTDPAEPEKLLYIYGPPGSGKSHLLNATGGSLGDDQKVISCHRLSTPFEPCGKFLLVDDLDRLPDNTELRNSLWEVFNQHYIAGHPMLFAGRVPPRELSTVDDHLISRLLWGLVARVDVSDDDSRRMLINKLAQDRQILLPQDLADWLLTVLPRDVNSLVNATETLYRTALQRKCRITLKMARELFQVNHPKESVTEGAVLNQNRGEQ